MTIYVSADATKKVQFKHKLAVGAIAGVSGTSIVYPMDIIKTNVQSMKSIPKGQSSIISMLQVSRQIIHLNGITGLWRGFSTCLVGIAPEKAIKLAVNDSLRERFEDNSKDGTVTLQEEMISGSIAGCLQLIVTVPYEMIKIRVQMQSNLPVTERKSAMNIIKELGIKNMYRGFTATLFRDVPFCCIFFPLYSKFKALQMSRINSSISNSSSGSIVSEPFHVGLISGMLSGSIAGVIVTPADMLKTRIQQGLNGDQGFLAYGREVIKKEGLSALFRGYQQRMLVIAPLYGFVSLAFEVQKAWLTTNQ